MEDRINEKIKTFETEFLKFLEDTQSLLLKISKKLAPGTYVLNGNDELIELFRKGEPPADDDLHLYFSYLKNETEQDLQFEVSINSQVITFHIGGVLLWAYGYLDPEFFKPKLLLNSVRQLVTMLLNGQIYLFGSFKGHKLCAVECIYLYDNNLTVIDSLFFFPLFGDITEGKIMRNHLNYPQLSMSKDFIFYDTTESRPFRGRKVSTLIPSPIKRKEAKQIENKLRYEQLYSEGEQGESLAKKVASRWQTWFLAAVTFIVILSVPEGWGVPAAWLLSALVFFVLLPKILDKEESRADIFIRKATNKFNAFNTKIDIVVVVLFLFLLSFFAKDSVLTSGQEVSIWSMRNTSLLIPVSFIIILGTALLSLFTNKPKLTMLKATLSIIAIVVYIAATELSALGINNGLYPKKPASYFYNNIFPLLLLGVVVLQLYRVWKLRQVKSQFRG